MVNPRFLDLAERMKNPELPKERTPEEILQAKPRTTKTNKLERNAEGRPVIELTSIEGTGVNARTQEDYWTLMRVYECGDWMWVGGKLPIYRNNWEKNKEEFCVDAGKATTKEGEFCYSSKDFYLGYGCDIISIQEFYDKQKVTSEIIDEINEYFDNRGDKK